MDQVKFIFRAIPSEIFGLIYRPYVDVLLEKKDKSGWRKATMVVDTGADYTILPRSYADYLAIDVAQDCIAHDTHGVGGVETVYLYRGLLVKLGGFERKIPVGFLEKDDVPPLLGRHEFFETFRSLFEKHTVTFGEA